VEVLMTTSDKLRRDIDEGRGGDKVPFVDPAAAPLGTDDEAAGRSPSKEEIDQAARYEARDTSSAGSANSDERGRATSGRMRNGSRRTGLIVAVAILGVSAVILLAFILA
jgi:hypothetical protein